MNKISPLRITIATVAVALCAGGVMAAVQGYSYIYGNGYTNPATTLAGYLATADGGVVAVLNSPAPTAANQALRSITTGTNATAGFVNDPVATTTAAGVVRIGTSARIAATTNTATASTTATTVYGSDAQCILPEATTSAWGVSKFTTTLPLADGVPSPGSGGLELQSNHVHPAEGAARTIYYPTGTGGVAPTVLSRTPNGSSDSFSSSVVYGGGVAAAVFYDTSDSTDLAGLTIWPAGTYKVRMWLAVANGASSHVYVYAWITHGGFNSLCYTNGNLVYPLSSTLTEYDAYCSVASDTVLTPSEYLGLTIFAGDANGYSDTLTIGIGGATSTALIVPWAPRGVQNIAGGVGANISQVPCWGTYTSITTNTGTSTSVGACTIPIASTTAPSLVKLGATGGAQPTITCPQGQFLQGGTSNATGTGTATNTTTTQTCQNPSWITSTGTGLGTSTRGAVLYNGSTATGTNTVSSPVWGAPPVALSYGTPSGTEYFGVGNVQGTSTSVARADHVHALPALPSGSLVELWAYNPSSPTTVSTTSGYVTMTPGGGSFTTPAGGAVLEVLFNVQFGASNVNVANCVADISLSGYASSMFGTDGYAQPSYAVGGYVSTSSHALYTLYGSTTYTVTPKVAAIGTGATCIVTGASMWIREFVL